VVVLVVGFGVVVLVVGLGVVVLVVVLVVCLDVVLVVGFGVVDVPLQVAFKFKSFFSQLYELLRGVLRIGDGKSPETSTNCVFPLLTVTSISPVMLAIPYVLSFKLLLNIIVRFLDRDLSFQERTRDCDVFPQFPVAVAVVGTLTSSMVSPCGLFGTVRVMVIETTRHPPTVQLDGPEGESKSSALRLTNLGECSQLLRGGETAEVSENIDNVMRNDVATIVNLF